MTQTLPKYTPAQAEAIAYLDEPLQIFACAGSGKDGSSDRVPSADYRLAEVSRFDGVGEVWDVVPERARSNLLIEGDVRNVLTHASHGFRNSLMIIWAGRDSRTLQEAEAQIA
jgi:hypothetical protein